MKGIIAGVCAGFAGAAVWALIAWLTGYEIGWIAWAIGAAVGAAVAWGSEGTPAMGIAAVVISIVAILGGKYLTVELFLAQQNDMIAQELSTVLETDEYAIASLADEIAAEIEENGGTVEWPEVEDSEDVTIQEEYPAEIWAQAEKAWDEKTPAEKEEHKNAIQQNIEEGLAMMNSYARKEGFRASFSLFDALFFFLAIGTAYKIGSKADS
jgi:phosphate/sulfate permease